MFSLFQSSRDLSVPIHLYEVTYGIGVSSRMLMTDSEYPQPFGDDVYQPAQIRHSDIVASGTLDKTTLDLNTPHTNPLTDLFRQYPPSQVVNLSIFRGERDDPDAEFKHIWSGRILGFSIDKYESKFTCEPIATAVRRPGLRRNYQYGCPHVVYEGQCRASKVAVSTPATVVSVANSEVTLALGWHGAIAAEKFINGLMQWTDSMSNPVIRTILGVSGGGNVVVRLNGRTDALQPGADIVALPGCNHQMSDCGDLHNNLPNYGGCPWIPTKNPVGNYNNFY